VQGCKVLAGRGRNPVGKTEGVERINPFAQGPGDGESHQINKGTRAKREIFWGTQAAAGNGPRGGDV
jgi:hypothetical protein